MPIINFLRCYKSDNAETDKNMWNFWTSMDFASTIMTTVGKRGVMLSDAVLMPM